MLAQASFLSIIRDQGGCRFRTSYKQEGDSQFIQAESTGISCGPDGFASGTGQLLLKRSDGVELKRIKASFHRGLPITDGTLDLPVVGFDQEQNMLLWLSSDPLNRVHYLVRAKHNRYAGSWHLEQPLLLALTDNAELFRQAESIRTILFAPLAQLDKQRPKETWISAYAMRDLAKGLLKGDRDAWLYEVGLQRNYRSKLWDFDPNRANNHLFAFERKQAEIARRETEQKARNEHHLQRTAKPVLPPDPQPAAAPAVHAAGVPRAGGKPAVQPQRLAVHAARLRPRLVRQRHRPGTPGQHAGNGLAGAAADPLPAQTVAGHA